jgi:hypothetical protein
MSQDTTRILYERTTLHGHVVRIRRVPSATAAAVAAVIEVDRRVGTPREAEGGIPPALMAVEGDSEAIANA